MPVKNTHAAAPTLQVFHGPSWSQTDFETLVNETSLQADVVVMGEKHDTPSVQDTEALLIQKITEQRLKSNPDVKSTLWWEFLNASQQTEIATIWDLILKVQATTQDLIKLTQGGIHNTTYIPVMETVKALKGNPSH